MPQSTTKTIVDWVFAKTANNPCSISGRCASPSEQRQYSCLLATWSVLLTETTKLPFDTLQPYVGRALRDSQQDVVEWIRVLTSGRDALMRQQPELAEASLDRWIPSARARIRTAISGDVEEFKVMLQLCSYCRKAQFDRPDLDAEALEKYLDSERRCERSFQLSPPWVLREMRDIITQWFKSFHISSYRPHHGPGAVAEPCTHTVRDKYLAMRYVSKLDALLLSLGHGPLASYIPWGLQLKPPIIGVDGTDDPSMLASRGICVPKSYKAKRFVKPEPVTLQFGQKGVQDDLYKYIENHPYLSTRLPLTNQGQNRDAAREGSSSGWLATLDLSSASDSVSAELVEYLFAETELGLWLQATRSEYVVLPGKRLIPTSIFAGMGSSLCFPVESIVFASVCEVVLRHVRSLALDVHPIERFYTVYGDDIIVPVEWYDALVHLLTQLGFVVNDEKSFHTGSFRESCGMEAFAGHDVTPLLYPFSFVPGKGPLPSKRWKQGRGYKKGLLLSPEFAASLISVANRAILEYGFSELRYAFLYIGRMCGYEGFVFTERVDMRLGSNGRRSNVVFGHLTIWSPEASNGHLPRRFNTDLQREEAYGYCLYSSIRKDQRIDDLDDLIAYWESLRGRSPEVMDPYSAIRATKVHLSRRWAGWE